MSDGIKVTKDENTAVWVDNILRHCLFTDDEYKKGEPAPSDAVVVNGIMRNFALHPGRLAEKKEEVREILNLMNDAFHIQHGGGWSFLNLCMDKNDNHWAEHPTMEVLVALAIAEKLGTWLPPYEMREMWKALHGGMPYVQFDTRVQEPSKEDTTQT